ncbi:hypothetical protein EYF80_012821 [Liparis tanakae]|uniref:Uncharacterized protein n=1 Tax=Liparis tanakae TaxID=230148 RepID=A0A4Z2IH03_9TELE|nr:hypothetical protein EYF80_012821 [Liparis tanakae]
MCMIQRKNLSKPIQGNGFSPGLGLGAATVMDTPDIPVALAKQYSNDTVECKATREKSEMRDLGRPHTSPLPKHHLQQLPLFLVFPVPHATVSELSRAGSDIIRICQQSRGSSCQRQPVCVRLPPGKL